MAELTDLTPATDTATSNCCSPAAQETCCEPGEKAACCEASAAGGSCGCAAGPAAPVGADELRETVRARYAAAAVATTDPTTEAGCHAPAGGGLITDEQGRALRRQPLR